MLWDPPSGGRRICRCRRCRNRAPVGGGGGLAVCCGGCVSSPLSSSAASPQPEDPQRISSVPSLPSEDLVSPRLWRHIGCRCRKRGGLDSSSPITSAGAGAGVGVVVATGRSDKSDKLERYRTKILYDKLVFQLF